MEIHVILSTPHWCTKSKLARKKCVFLLLNLKELLLESNTLSFLSVFYNNNLTIVFFVSKYEKYSVMLDDMCTKPCQVQLSDGLINV